jgi:hypothetical protein
MPARRLDWFAIAIGSFFLLLIALPYLLAFSAGGPEAVFGGFLFNPIDGNSYLAKMQAGFQGDWLYTLPYTLEPGPGAFLFAYYVLLGHLSRLIQISPIWVFHLARLAGAVLMLLALWRFYSRIIRDRVWQRTAFALALFAAGLGWLGMAAGYLTADMWVAEAYPFLSAYANPHFPLGLAFLVYLLTPPQQQEPVSGHPRLDALSTILVGLVLAIVLPFGLVVAAVVLAGLAAWNFLHLLGLHIKGQISRQVLGYLVARSQELRKLLLSLTGGGLVLLYDQWVVASDPMFSGWNAQNLTPSPVWWDVALSFAPLLLLAVPGGWLVWREKDSKQRVLLVWVVLGLLLVYLPFGLQRRFFTGLLIPLAGLAALGLQCIASSLGAKWARLVAVLAFILVLPTTLLNLMIGLYGIQTRDPLLYITADEMQAFRWLAENSPDGAGVLAGPQSGLLIPAFSGRRVVYGHPFETVEASRQEALVERLFTGNYFLEDLKVLSQVDYVFYGPRERAMGGPAFLNNLEQVWMEGEVIIYHSSEPQPP